MLMLLLLLLMMVLLLFFIVVVGCQMMIVVLVKTSLSAFPAIVKAIPSIDCPLAVNHPSIKAGKKTLNIKVPAQLSILDKLDPRAQLSVPKK